MKRRICSIIAIILCFAMVLSLFSCVSASNSTGKKKDTSDEIEDDDDKNDVDTSDKKGDKEENDEDEEEEEDEEEDIVTDDDTESESETESKTETESETESETQTESETESETQTETESETQTETESETETETEPVVKEDPIPGKTKTDETLRAKSYNLAVKSSTFRYIGRVKPTSGGLIFDHSASTLEFQGFMTGEVNLTISSTNGESYYTVYIDGKRSDTRFKVSGANQVITVAKFTGKYFHRISIVKQTEVDWSTSTIHRLQITGYLEKAPAQKDLYIEFYGDSLTAGYGNIGKPGDSNAGSAPYEDATKTYGYLLSQRLDADCSILARSGVGLAPCWSERFYERFSKYSYSRGSEQFRFTGARVPDLVVIHLGANDYVYGSSKENFIKYGKELVDYIRNGYGKNMPIIWAHDPGEGRPEWIKEILNYYGGEAKGFYSVALPWSEAGAGGHPSANEHQKHANIIYNLIKEKKILK